MTKSQHFDFYVKTIQPDRNLSTTFSFKPRLSWFPALSLRTENTAVRQYKTHITHVHMHTHNGTRQSRKSFSTFSTLNTTKTIIPKISFQFDFLFWTVMKLVAFPPCHLEGHDFLGHQLVLDLPASSSVHKYTICNFQFAVCVSIFTHFTFGPSFPCFPCSPMVPSNPCHNKKCNCSNYIWFDLKKK